MYTQLEVLKTKAMRRDNPHISKRRGGRKPGHRKFSLQAFHARHSSSNEQHQQQQSQSQSQSLVHAQAQANNTAASLQAAEHHSTNSDNSSPGASAAPACELLASHHPHHAPSGPGNAPLAASAGSPNGAEPAQGRLPALAECAEGVEAGLPFGRPAEQTTGGHRHVRVAPDCLTQAGSGDAANGHRRPMGPKMDSSAGHTTTRDVPREADISGGAAAGPPTGAGCHLFIRS